MSTQFTGHTASGEEFHAATRFSGGRERGTGFRFEASGGQFESATHFTDESGREFSHQEFHETAQDCDFREFGN